MTTAAEPGSGLAGPVRRRDAPEGMRRRKLRPRPALSRGWSWRYAVVASLAMLVLDFVLASALPREALRIGVGSLILDAGMLVALVPLYRGRGFVAADLGLRSTSAARAVGLTFAALIAYLAVAAIWALIVLGQHRSQITPQLHAGVAGTVIAGIAMCLVAPVAEEIFFRGFVFRALRNRLNLWWSVGIVAAVFAAGHASTYAAGTLPIKAAFAVIACLLYEQTGSLYPAIALHVLVDGTGYEASVSHGGIWIVPLVFAAFGLIVLLRHRFRAPTANELAAFRGHPRLRTLDVGQEHRLRTQSGTPGRLAPIIETLATRFGYHSARWVLGMLGGVLVVVAFVITLINVSTAPQAHESHSTASAALGLLFIVGLLMIISAIMWRLLRRPPRR